MKNLEQIFIRHNLNKRETQAATLLIREGLSNEEIGKRILRSTASVKGYFTSIYRKFGVKGDRELMSLLMG